MAGPVNLTEVDFEQIKNNLINYLKSTEKFTDYDFEGSNLSVILNLIAYQAQLNAYSVNMVANESFLSTATIRNNVVSNAKQIGYLPTSTKSASSFMTFEVDLKLVGPLEDIYPMGFPQFLEIRPGKTFHASTVNDYLTFNVVDTQTAAVNGQGVAVFENIPIYEGVLINKEFVNDDSDFTQRFVLNNINIDTSTIRVEVQEDPNEERMYSYSQANNLTTLTAESRAYWIDEILDGQYELTFGDGLYGKKLVDGANITVSYVVSKGEAGNGIQGNDSYNFDGQLYDSFGTNIRTEGNILNVTTSQGGAPIESASSVKFRAPKNYASQNRCVTSGDYEAVIRQIYPSVEDMYVYGGETLEIPEYGRVYVVIKPITGEYLSNSTKAYIKTSLEPFRVASLDIVFMDPDILYIEADSLVYYDEKKTKKDSSAIISEVQTTLTGFTQSETVSKFGGSVKYSRIVGAIDDADPSISRNITNLRMRKNMIAAENTAASYEICFENGFLVDNLNPVISSTGFFFADDFETYFFENEPQQIGQTTGNVRLYRFGEFNEKLIIDPEFGTIDFDKGEVKLGYKKPITIASTVLDNAIIELRAKPLDSGKNITAKETVFLSFDVAKSTISAIVDTE